MLLGVLLQRSAKFFAKYFGGGVGFFREISNFRAKSGFEVSRLNFKSWGGPNFRAKFRKTLILTVVFLEFSGEFLVRLFPSVSLVSHCYQNHSFDESFMIHQMNKLGNLP